MTPPPILVAALWASVVLVGAWRLRSSAPARLPGPAHPAPVPPPAPRGLAGLGRALQRRLPQLEPLPAPAVGSSVVAAAALLLVDPRGAVAVLVLGWSWARARTIAHRRRRAEQLLDELPATIDLLALATSAGHTVRWAVELAARHGRGPLAEALGRAAFAVGRGARLADALDDVGVHLGEPVRPLLAALVSAERHGTELGPALVRLADLERQARRRRAEERARRVPVRLLGPLVLVILPAFVLLTVVPMLAGSLPDLGAAFAPVGP